MYSHWHYLRLRFDDLVDIYIEQLTEIAEHSFMTCWNYCHTKGPKNLKQSEVIVVQDIAQNYLCKHQDEPQALHRVHQQVILNPSVVHHVCTKPQCW